jgi:hypothetical protein
MQLNKVKRSSHRLAALLLIGPTVLCAFAVAKDGVTAGPLLVQDSTPYESTTESPRLYDSETADTVRGTIINFETVKPAEEASPFLQIEVKTGQGTIRVHLAPQWFMEEQGHRLDLQKGNEVEIKGSKNVVDGKEVFIAAEVKQMRSDDRLRLRQRWHAGVEWWRAPQLTALR